MNSFNDVTLTLLFSKLRQGEEGVWDEIFFVVYHELHRLAHQQLFRSWGVDTINTTVLVHETYLKLIKHTELELQDREHFYAIAAKAMRQIVINYAEQKLAQKRGGDWQQVSMTESLVNQAFAAEKLIVVDDALKALDKLDAKLGQVVEMRFFAGMSESEMAVVMGVNERTVRRQWKKAKALLSQILREDIDDAKDSK